MYWILRDNALNTAQALYSSLIEAYFTPEGQRLSPEAGARARGQSRRQRDGADVHDPLPPPPLREEVRVSQDLAM